MESRCYSTEGGGNKWMKEVKKKVMRKEPCLTRHVEEFRDPGVFSRVEVTQRK